MILNCTNYHGVLWVAKKSTTLPRVAMRCKKIIVKCTVGCLYIVDIDVLLSINKLQIKDKNDICHNKDIQRKLRAAPLRRPKTSIKTMRDPTTDLSLSSTIMGAVIIVIVTM